MKGICLLLLSIFPATILSAQDITFQVIPAAKKVGTQDAFQVSYVIGNANRVQKFGLTQTNDVRVLDHPSQSDHITEVNGVRSVQIEITYVFQAKRKGMINLPQGVISVDGREFKTNQTSIEVIEGSVRTRQPNSRTRNSLDDPFATGDPFADEMFAALQRQQQQMMQMMMQRSGMSAMPAHSAPRGRSIPPQQAEVTRENLGSNLFIRVDVDKTQVTLGEQITASYKLYTRVPMKINLTRLPSLVGFWNQDFKIPKVPKPRMEMVNGKEYQVFEIKRTALFPTQTGVLELDPAGADGIAVLLKPKRVKQENPFADDPMFSGFFGSMLMSDPAFNSQYVTEYDQQEVKVNLKSEPVRIEVSDIGAENRPASFKGAIGSYEIESNIDKTEMTTDDVASINFKISGTGNLKLIEAPEIKFPAEIDAFDVQEKDTITNTNNIIAGYKTFTYSFTPKSAGTFTVPAAEFSFYDPETKQYKTLNTPSYTLNIKPGKGEESTKGNVLPRDIHDIHTQNKTISRSEPLSIPDSPFYWGGFALPMLAYIGLLAFKRKEDKLQQNVALFKNKHANRVALKRLETAERYLKLSAQNSFYEETAKAVWLYLSDKLAIPLSALSREVATQKLDERQIPQSLKDELFRVAQECEMALYAPDSGTMKMYQTYSDAYKLIGKLEDFLG